MTENTQPANAVGQENTSQVVVLQEHRCEETVKVQRSVKITRLLLLGMLAGAVLAVAVTLLFPVVPEGYYTMAQIAGFMGVLGAAAGLLLAAMFALALNVAAKKKQGTARAVRVDVK